MHHFDAGEPRASGRGRSVQRSLRRHHRIEQGQRQRPAHPAQHRAPRKVFPGDEHGYWLPPLAGFAGSATASSTRRIWNGADFTIPNTNDENLLPLLSASRAIARTAGISYDSVMRPSPYASRFSVNVPRNASE